MKKNNLVLFLLVHQAISFGQPAPSKQTVSTLGKFDMGLQGIGLTYEPRIGHAMTTELSLGAGGGYYIDQFTFAYHLSNPALYFSVTPKYFYNIKKRINKGKRFQNNSGNYVGARLKYVMPFDKTTNTIRPSLLMNIHWGLQRPLGNKWIFSSHAGAGYAMDIDGIGILYPSLDVKFSYVLSRQRKQ